MNILDSVTETRWSEINLKPYWLWEKFRLEMRVQDHLKNTAAFIGIKNTRGDFVPLGSGFGCLMSASGLGTPYVVTALHVIEQIKSDTVWVRMAKHGGGFHMLELPKADFFQHPDHDKNKRYIDVTACPLPTVTPQDPIAWIRESDFIKPEEIEAHSFGVGDEVATIGLLSKVPGETRNIPIVRIGNIAAMPEEPVPTDKGPMEAYLIETRSIDGLSGSAVLINTGPQRIMTSNSDVAMRSIRAVYFIGLVHGHYVIKNPIDVVVGDPEFRTTEPYGDMNTGIAIVVPSGRIVELLNHPEEVALRESAAALKNAKVGPTSD